MNVYTSNVVSLEKSVILNEKEIILIDFILYFILEMYPYEIWINILSYLRLVDIINVVVIRVIKENTVIS